MAVYVLSAAWNKFILHVKARNGEGSRRGEATFTIAGNNGDDNKTGGKPVGEQLNGWSHRHVTASRSHEERAVQPPAAHLVSIS